MRFIPIRLRPLIGDQNRRLCRSWFDALESKTAHVLRKRGKHLRGRPLFAICGHNAKLSFVRRTQIGYLRILRERRVCVTPDEETVRSRGKTGIKRGSLVLRNGLRRILRRRRSHFLNHDRPARTPRKCGFKCRPVCLALREHCIREEALSVDRIGVNTEEIHFIPQQVRPEWAMAHIFHRRSHYQQMPWVVTAQRTRYQSRPVDSGRIRSTRGDPEWRLIGQVPGEDCVVLRKVPSQFRRKVCLQLQHVRVRLRIAAMAVWNVPIRLAHLAAYEQHGIQIDVVAARQGSEEVQFLECLRVVIAWTRLEPGPYQIKPDGIHAELVHLRKIGFNRCGIPLIRPFHRRLRRNPIYAHGQKALSAALEVVAGEPDWRLALLRRGSRFRGSI